MVLVSDRESNILDIKCSGIAHLVFKMCETEKCYSICKNLLLTNPKRRIWSQLKTLRRQNGGLCGLRKAPLLNFSVRWAWCFFSRPTQTYLSNIGDVKLVLGANKWAHCFFSLIKSQAKPNQTKPILVLSHVKLVPGARWVWCLVNFVAFCTGRLWLAVASSLHKQTNIGTIILHKYLYKYFVQIFKQKFVLVDFGSVQPPLRTSKQILANPHLLNWFAIPSSWMYKLNSIL